MTDAIERIVVHRTFKLLERRPEEVWAALTQPEALQEWLCTEASVDLRVGGAFDFRGDVVFGRGGGQRITALEPGHLLRFTWSLGESAHDVAEITWRLDPQLDLTRLVVDEALTFEGAGRPRRGWLASTLPLSDTYLPQLLAYLELGFCPVRVDANTDRRELRIEMELAGVSTRAAFAAVSEPEHLNAWLTDAVKLEPWEGGELGFLLAGESEPLHESIYELEPDRALTTSAWPPPDGRIRYITASAGDAEAPAARLTCVRSGFSDGSQLWSILYPWQGVLLRLARYLLLGVQKPGNDETDERILEIDLDATPERVWRALTDSKELAAWFCEHADVDLEQGRYDFWGRHTLGAPGRELAHHPVLAVEPGRRLRYAWAAGREHGWRYAKDAAIELTLTALHGGEGTCLRVVRENEGLPTPTGGQPDHFWSGALMHLRAWLELGRPGPRYDYTWPCENGEFEIQAEIGAPREVVFRDFLAGYEGAPEPGSPKTWTVRWGYAPGGGTRVRTVSPGHSFSVDYLFSEHASPKVLEHRFEEEGGRTRITLTQSGFVAGRHVRGIATGFFSGFFEVAWRLETGGRWPTAPRVSLQPGVPPTTSRWGIRVLSGSTAHAPVAHPRFDPGDYVGIYEDLAIPGETCRVFDDAGKLWIDHATGRYDLVPRGEDRFTLRGLASVEMRRDAKGRVQSMTLNFGSGNRPLRRLDEAEQPRPRILPSEADLGRYVGRYRLPADGAVLEVGIQGRGLAIQLDTLPRLPPDAALVRGAVLPSSEPHTFHSAVSARRFEFRVDAQGVATELSVDGDGGLQPFHCWAERIPV